MSVIKTNNVQIGQSVTATNNFTLYQPATPDGTVRLGNGNSGSVTDLVTLTSAGNLGIGTSSPGYKLDVAGVSRFNGFFVGYNTTLYSTDGTLSNYAVNNNVYLNGNAGMGLSLGGDGTLNQRINIYGGSANYIALTTSGTERLRLDSSGNLGLGVTPSGWNGVVKGFDISGGGSIYAGSVNIGLASNYYLGTSGSYIYKTSSYACGYVPNYANNGSHAWLTAPSGTAGNAISFTQAMTLDASGALCIGQTSKSGSSTLSVSGPEATVTVTCTQTDITRTAINFYQGATASGYIRVNGANCYYQTVSDQRLKTNVAPAGSAIQSILNFPVDQFDWIADGTHQDFGAVAQKAIRFIPEMVTVPANENEMWGIDWSKAVPRLIKTIQELSAQVSDLKTELNELKQKVNA